MGFFCKRVYHGVQKIFFIARKLVASPSMLKQFILCLFLRYRMMYLDPVRSFFKHKSIYFHEFFLMCSWKPRYLKSCSNAKYIYLYIIKAYYQEILSRLTAAPSCRKMILLKGSTVRLVPLLPSIVST